MLTEHGVFPHEVVDLPLREKLFMFELLKKADKELEKLRKK